MYRSLRDDLRAAVPECTGRLRLPGLTHDRGGVARDRLGLPHIRAHSMPDAFFAQGFVHAQDRLWQMDYDRHRAHGRAARYLGAAALRQDRLLRRIGLEGSARADYDAVDRRDARHAGGLRRWCERLSTDHVPLAYRIPAPRHDTRALATLGLVCGVQSAARVHWRGVAG